MSNQPKTAPNPPSQSGVVEQHTHGKILVITLRRESKRNAIDAETTAGIDAALDRLDDDDGLRVGILTGGSVMFSAGTDLARTAGPPTPRGGEYGVIRRKRRKPLIAAVEGFALGGGMEIVLACDLVCASRGTRFGLPEVQKALVPTCGGLFRPVRALPLNVARELMLTGDPLDAERAHALGFVNRLTEPGGALDAALALAERIVRNGPVAVDQSLAAVQALNGADDVTAWALTDSATAAIWRSADAFEGRNAFIEKREPRWTGK